MNAGHMHAETEDSATVRPTLRRRLATSQGSLARLLRWTYRSVNNFAVPAPKIIVKPLLWLFLFVRNIYYFAVRVFICEPLFKAYCTKYGKHLHTGCYLHWITGKGDIVLGDNVTIDGKVNIAFAARFSDHPTLQVGDNTGIGHGCSFTIGKLISIGSNCNLSGDISIMDSSGHDTDPAARLAYKPPKPEDVRPVIIRDGVWIGRQCILFPGVKVGEGSVISAGSVVRTHVPPYSVVAGNPARVMFRLKQPDQSRQAM
ncbi:MAG: acyltransferase [Terracidiphilus sp.]|jgi:acetyltransferase-like isoleucine patch superfamily enzyme